MWEIIRCMWQSEFHDTYIEYPFHTYRRLLTPLQHTTFVKKKKQNEIWFITQITNSILSFIEIFHIFANILSKSYATFLRLLKTLWHKEK